MIPMGPDVIFLLTHYLSPCSMRADAINRNGLKLKSTDYAVHLKHREEQDMKTKLLRNAFTLGIMLAIAIGVGVGTISAQVVGAYWFQATTAATTVNGTHTQLGLHKLNMTDGVDEIKLEDDPDLLHMGDGGDRLHFAVGDDTINMGLDNDILMMSYGDDAMAFYGGEAIISFDLGEWDDWFDRDNEYKDYIWCDTPDNGEGGEGESQMEIRSDNIEIIANEGDVTITLGS